LRLPPASLEAQCRGVVPVPAAARAYFDAFDGPAPGRSERVEEMGSDG